MSLDPYFYILTLCRGDIFCLLPMKTSIIISLWYLNILRSSQSLFVEDLLKIVNNIEHHSISEKKEKIRRSFVRVYDSLIWLVSLSHCVIKYLWKLESVKKTFMHICRENSQDSHEAYLCVWWFESDSRYLDLCTVREYSTCHNTVSA